MPEQQGCGTGQLRSGQRDLGLARYEIHVGMADKPGTIVELESPPVAQDGEILDLSLEDGRVLQIQVRGVSPYCRVVGERSAKDRRTAGKESTETSDVDVLVIGPPRQWTSTTEAVLARSLCPVLVTHDAIPLPYPSAKGRDATVRST